MSDQSGGPGWWQVSDGRWYPPEQHPARQATSLAPPMTPYSPGPSSPQGRSTNGLAIASLVLSIVYLFGIGSILAIIFSTVARRQIKKAHGTQGGEGLATAGFVIGIVGIVGTILILVVHHVVYTQQQETPIQHFHLGETAYIAPGIAANGITRVTVHSLVYPATSQSPQVRPSSGMQFGVAEVSECAGSSGASLPPGSTSVFALLPAGTDRLGFSPTNDAWLPALDLVSVLAPNHCARGFVTFEVPIGYRPTTVRYVLFPNNKYDWAVPKPLSHDGAR